MDTRSTASSSTDAGREPGGEPEDPRPADLGRRAFFRSVGRDAARTANDMLDVADALRRGTSAATGELVGLLAGGGTGRLTPGSHDAVPLAAAPTTDPDATFRSPYRLDDRRLVVLDRRALPDRAELSLADGRAVARAIRAGAVAGGPLLAQLAAYGMWLSAVRVAERAAPIRESELGATALVLRRASGRLPAVDAVVARLEAAVAALGADAPAEQLVWTLRREADHVASGAMLAHAALARHLAAWLPRSDEGVPLRVLMHGDSGPISNGMVGTGLAAVHRVHLDGDPLHVWVSEARPSEEGTRLTAPQLRHWDVPHTLVPDAAAVAMVRRREVDVVLLASDRLSARGDAEVLLGGAALAATAVRQADPPVPVVITAPRSAVAVDDPLREGVPDHGRESVSASDITVVATERGVHAHPIAEALAAAASID